MNHDIPLDALLSDAAAALELVQLHGLSRACLIADVLISGTPLIGESFIADIVSCIEAAKLHAHKDNDDTRVALVAALDAVETWGLEPERRTQSALREIVAVTETIRQLATSETPDTAMIASLAEGALSVLGFPPFKEDGIEI